MSKENKFGISDAELKRRIKDGAVRDEDGYCACPECGSRNLLHDGPTLDNGSIMCLNSPCSYSINGSDGWEMIARWNAIPRE